MCTYMILIMLNHVIFHYFFCCITLKGATEVVKNNRRIYTHDIEIDEEKQQKKNI